MELMPGFAMLYPVGPVPTGWLPCDGRAFNKSASPALYDLFKRQTEKPGDPEDVFRTPTALPYLPKGTLLQLVIKA